MDFFEQLLTGASPRSGVHPETLEMLGRKAASEFVRRGTPLNKAVADAVSDQKSFGNEHIKRVVEFANTFAFQELFQKSEDKNVHFDVADPAVIIRDLKDGGSPAHDGKTMAGGMGDYMSPPPSTGKMEKDQFADPESGMEHLFQMNDQDAIRGNGQAVEKTASIKDAPAGSHANPIDDVYDLHQRLQATRTSLVDGNERLDLLQKEAQENFYEEVRRELAPDGAGLGGVIRMVEKIASVCDDNLCWDASEAMGEAINRVLSTGVMNPAELQKSMEKRAGQIVNLDHPLTHTVSALIKLAEERAKNSLALAEVESGLKKTASFIRKHAL